MPPFRAELHSHAKFHSRSGADGNDSFVNSVGGQDAILALMQRRIARRKADRKIGPIGDDKSHPPSGMR